MQTATFVLQAVCDGSGHALTVATFALSSEGYVCLFARLGALCAGWTTRNPDKRGLRLARRSVVALAELAEPIVASRWRLQVRLPRWAYIPGRARAAGLDWAARASPGAVLLPLLLTAVRINSVYRPHFEPQWQLAVALYARTPRCPACCLSTVAQSWFACGAAPQADGAGGRGRAG